MSQFEEMFTAFISLAAREHRGISFMMKTCGIVRGALWSMAVEKNRIAWSLFLSPIGSMDLLIAGHARAKGLVLVTNNTGIFRL